MDPQIQQLDNQIQQTDTVKGLQEGQESIRIAIEEDRKANQVAFDKGAAKFDDLDRKVEKMEIQIRDGFNEVKKVIAENKLQDKDDEIKKLNKRLDARDQIKNGVIITLVGGILLAGAVYLLKIMLSVPQVATP